MRSPYLADFRHQLSELNNRLSHYIFVWEQFYLDNAAILIKSKSNQTTKIYPLNRFAPQYDVKLEKLDQFHQDTSVFILKSLFILIHTEFEVYMRNIYELARKIEPGLPHLQIKERVPDKIFEHLGLDATTLLEQQEIWTLEYLRLRRNRIVHSGGQSKGELAECIKNKGNALQRYWQSRLSNGIFGVNFQSQDTNNFIKEEIFDFINIWRALCKTIDNFIMERITEDKIIIHLHDSFLKERIADLKRWGLPKSKRKFLGYIKMKFGINLIEEDVKDFLINGAVA